MKNYGVNELRKMFLEFFESKGHLKMNSFSLIPHNDNSLLLINSGMAPLKPYFTGQEIPPRRRVTTCQKCIRTGDIENVGKTARHGTFFEMLGNFSFGDYFKHDAIHWTWEFLTEVVGLDKNRLYPSVYLEDDEAFDIWNKEIGVDKDRIFRFGKEDNFWEHGAGPCGPCSEVYYDRGEKYGCGRAGFVCVASLHRVFTLVKPIRSTAVRMSCTRFSAASQLYSVPVFCISSASSRVLPPGAAHRSSTVSPGFASTQRAASWLACPSTW